MCPILISGCTFLIGHTYNRYLDPPGHMGSLLSVHTYLADHTGKIQIRKKESRFSQNIFHTRIQHHLKIIFLDLVFSNTSLLSFDQKYLQHGHKFCYL